MFKLKLILLLGATAFVASAHGGTTIYNGSISQSSPPGSVNNEQVLIINNDRHGNQQVLSIGNGTKATVVTGPKPCNRDAPTVAMDCTDKDLRGVDWEGARLTAGRFDGADLRGATLQSATMDNVTFNKARLDSANLGSAEIVNGSFNGASLNGARLEGAKMVNTDFMDSELSAANLRRTTMVNTGFMDSDLRGADLTGSQFINADFQAARLGQAIWIDGRPCAQNSRSTCRP